MCKLKVWLKYYTNFSGMVAIKLKGYNFSLLHANIS